MRNAATQLHQIRTCPRLRISTRAVTSSRFLFDGEQEAVKQARHMILAERFTRVRIVPVLSSSGEICGHYIVGRCDERR